MRNTVHPEVKLRSVNDTCRILNISRSSVYRLISRNELLVVKIGSRTLIRTSCIEQIAGEAA
jgi:excisionase family DNA binding protein